MVRVLVIDDEEGITDILQTVLEMEDGVEVCVINNPKKIYELFQERTFDLVFTDIQMPQVHGSEVCKFLEQNYPDLPVILMSGFFDQLTEINYGNIVAKIRKPFEIEQLTRLVRQQGKAA